VAAEVTVQTGRMVGSEGMVGTGVDWRMPRSFTESKEPTSKPTALYSQLPVPPDYEFVTNLLAQDNPFLCRIWGSIWVFTTIHTVVP
jgi:hypothetical protein